MALNLPTPGGDAGTWGTKVNSAFNVIDARIPDVTGVPNGYILTVSGGVWTVAAAPTYSGFVVSSTEPVGAADGTVWIQV